MTGARGPPCPKTGPLPEARAKCLSHLVLMPVVASSYPSIGTALDLSGTARRGGAGTCDVVHAMCRNKETGEAKLKSKNNASSASSSSSSTTNARLRVTEVDVREEKDVEKVLDAIMTEGGEEAKVALGR